MAKMTSFRWAKKDDPMFTGRFTVHSKRKEVTAIHTNKNQAKIDKYKLKKDKK